MNKRGRGLLLAGSLALLGLWQLWHLQAMQAQAGAAAPVLLEAVHYDGFAYRDADEAVALRTIGPAAVDISGWQLSDGRAASTAFPPGTVVWPARSLWLTGDGEAFARQFGFRADVLLDKWPGFANAGDEVFLQDASGEIVDTLVYGASDAGAPGWNGPAVQPYTVRGVFGAEGQILSRKLDQQSGQPVADTNRAVDWIQDRSDPASGRRVRYPGWDLDTFFFSTAVTQTATLTVAVAPDNAYETLVRSIAAARESVWIEMHTFENVAVAEALIQALARGVTVRVLLEGSPVGGVPPQEKYVCARLEAAGGSCWFMIQDEQANIADRYRYVHAKFILIDQALAVISSENLSYNSLPDDDKRDGTWGRRGVMLLTDAPAVVSGLARIFKADWDPYLHADILRWQADHPVYGRPPAGFAPVTSSGGITYSVRYPVPAAFQGKFAFTLQQAPENLLRDQDGLLGLVARAAKGDTILVQQLQERPYWGPSTSNPQDDPNLRLAHFLAAARRGAVVRLMLDSFFDQDDDPLGNAATCALVNDIARREQLALSCVLGNPSGLGIHNKMILLHVDGRGYVHAGSWNGSELASKGNREVGLLVQSDEAYTYLARMFERDLAYVAYLPLFFNAFKGPAQHVLISEFVYDAHGADAAEFIELVNPTPYAVDLGGYGLGDAWGRDDFEDVRRFPPGTILEVGEVVVVTISALDFQAEYGRWPDFEILETSTAVANMLDDPTWGHSEAFLQLGNQGDEVILRDPADNIVDALAYGTGEIPGQVSCGLLSGTNHSFERHPYWLDRDNCPQDMRDWPFPTPGAR